MKPITKVETKVSLNLPYQSATTATGAVVQVQRSTSDSVRVKIGWGGDWGLNNAQVFRAEDLREMAALFVEMAEALDSSPMPPATARRLR